MSCVLDKLLFSQIILHMIRIKTTNSNIHHHTNTTSTFTKGSTSSFSDASEEWFYILIYFLCKVNMVTDLLLQFQNTSTTTSTETKKTTQPLKQDGIITCMTPEQVFFSVYCVYINVFIDYAYIVCL